MATYASSGFGPVKKQTISLLNPKETDPTPNIVLKSTATSAPTAKVSSAASSTTGNNPYVTGLDDNGQMDYSVLIQNLISRGASADQVQTALSQRNAKAVMNGYTQYQDDATAKAAQAYIDGMKATATPQYLTFQDMLESSGYNEVREKNDAALAARLAQLESYYGGQKTNINTDAEEQARQAYISYMQSKNSLPQSLAASGFTGGMADSQRLALELGLQNNQREIGQAKATALNDLDTALNSARAQTTIQSLENEAALAQQAVSDWNDWMKTYNSQSFQAGQNALDRETAQAKWDYSVAQDERSWALQNAELLAKLGDYSGYAALFGWDEATTKSAVETYQAQLGLSSQEAAVQLAKDMGAMGDLSGYEALGWDTSYKQAEQKLALQQKQAALKAKTASTGTSKTKSTGSSTSSNTAKGNLFQDMAASGSPYTYLVQNYQKYGVAYNGLSGVWGEYQTWKDSQGTSDGDETETPRMDTAIFNGLKNQIIRMATSGSLGTAIVMLESNRNAKTLSDKQTIELIDLLNQYGADIRED